LRIASRANEMMISTLTAQQTSLFHAERAYPASSRTVKSFEPRECVKKVQTATSATAACCSPENAVNMDYLSNYASGTPLFAQLSIRRSVRSMLRSRLSRAGSQTDFCDDIDLSLTEPWLPVGV
jgi:hypothetical protein